MKSTQELWTAGLDRLRKISSSALLFLVAAYRSFGTTHLGGACRFSPSCSEYAVDAIKSHQPIYAVFLIGKRILKCRPGGPYGYDPVPCCGGHKYE